MTFLVVATTNKNANASLVYSFLYKLVEVSQDYIESIYDYNESVAFFLLLIWLEMEHFIVGQTNNNQTAHSSKVHSGYHGVCCV